MIQRINSELKACSAELACLKSRNYLCSGEGPVQKSFSIAYETVKQKLRNTFNLLQGREYTMHRNITYLDYVITVHSAAYDLRVIKFIFGRMVAHGKYEDVDELSIEESDAFDIMRRNIYPIDRPSSVNKAALHSRLDSLFANVTDWAARGD